jgi:hypothetical protein
MNLKVLFAIVIQITTCFCSLGQNNELSEKLQKSDIIPFKIGDTYSKWKSQLQLVKSNIDGGIYKLSNPYSVTINTVRLDKVELTFKNDRLAVIKLETRVDVYNSKLKESPDYERVKSSFSKIGFTLDYTFGEIDEFGLHSMNQQDDDKLYLTVYFDSYYHTEEIFDEQYDVSKIKIVIVAKNP